jgi:hypothetical protein
VAVLAVLLALPASVSAQSSIPPEYRGDELLIARGILDGNLIETNFRNHGEVSRWDDLPWGVWPRGVGGRHVDGVGVLVSGRVPGERAKWADINPSWAGLQDTLLNPVILTYRDAGKRTVDGKLFGWTPLNGFHNTQRINSLGELEPTPALSDDGDSWPDFWPDRLDNPDDPGWSGQWNGFFGRGVFNADLESYYVIDDYTDREYQIDETTGGPLSQFGVFYADPSDSTKGGFGVQTGVRIFQWANILAEDAMFLLYRIKNESPTDYVASCTEPCDEDDTGLWYGQIMDYGLGNEEGDETGAFSPQEDVVFAWDQDGIGQRQDGTTYDLGYTGFAFLESPSRDEDGLDNDEDGITDELRFGGPGMLIEGQTAIRLFVESNYDMPNFIRFHGPLEDCPAFEAGVWWTGDENLDWLGYEDVNGNGVHDPAEPINSDVGLDGKGPFDLGYPGPDTGEGDGIPQNGEPNFDELDVDESDQIGLTGYDLSDRPFYESGDNLRDDSWLWDRIWNYAEPKIVLGTGAASQQADVEPFLLFSSGPVTLNANATTFFSTAWIFGADERDFFKNRRTVQSIYNADYQFAQPPFTPTLVAVAGDKRVTLTWDTVAVNSFDRFLQEFDFEGFRLYKGTDPLLSDTRTITNVDGIPTFFRPIAQWDLVNGIAGPVPVLDGSSSFDLGTDSGLSFFYVDDDVRNGVTYYYALVAYDRGVVDTTTGQVELDPQENVFNISVDLSGKVVGQSQNAAVIVPRSAPAGYVPGGTNEDVSRVTEGIGTGSMTVEVISEDELDPNGVYQVRFYSEPVGATQIYETTAFDIFKVSDGSMPVSKTPLVEVSPVIDGFVAKLFNDEIEASTPVLITERVGFLSNPGSANETYSLDPTTLDDVSSNWVATVVQDNTPSYTPSPFDFELRFVNPEDSTYRPPRIPRPEFLRDPIPVFAYNASTGEQIDILVEDVDRNRQYDPTDHFILSIPTSPRRNHYRVWFNVTEGQSSDPPDPGDVLRISVFKPFYTGDLFQFTTKGESIDVDSAMTELGDIAVVPNPYVGASQFEKRSQISGRGERLIQFINLPQQCTIRIFNLRGELVKTLEHDGIGSEGATFWDLRTEEGQDIAFGVYIYHVDADAVGEFVGKFAVVK